MNIIAVDQILEPEGLWSPTLNALLPNEDNYSVLLLQPNAQIEADATGVRNKDSAEANSLFSELLVEAHTKQPDLFVTPEYSTPWQTLVSALRAGLLPGSGKLWALGCESIKFDDLTTLRLQLADIATVLFESLPPEPARFTDPLVYVFRAKSKADEAAENTVLLVQFKTSPMSDPTDYEVNLLHKGTKVYQFGKAGESLRLVSLICSDVLDFEDADAKQVYDRTLVLHIQLNRKPREAKFRGYRDRLLQLSGDQTEIICLNWAMNARICFNGDDESWANVSASAWYSKSTKADLEDLTLSANHRRGLYYTWCPPLQSHALFFNFTPAMFFVTASKVDHLKIAAVRDRRRGPQLTETFVWDQTTRRWVDLPVAPDGFDSVVEHGGLAKARLLEIANVNPFEVERIVALSSGEMGPLQDWFTVQKLESCTINQSEVVRRVTFCQDPDHDAGKSRVRRLRRCAELARILTQRPLPPSLKEFEDGFQFEWIATAPHYNARSSSGARATVMYLSDDSSEAEIQQAVGSARNNLHKASATVDESVLAQQRVTLWYVRHQQLIQYKSHDMVQINEPRDGSPLSISRER